MPDGDLMTIPQVAQHLRVSEKTVSRLIQTGLLPGIHIGEGRWRLVRVRPEDLERYIQQKMKRA